MKNIEINPIKTSSSLGAAVFFLGLKNAVVLIHGAVGCASFDKVTLTKHFRENIPIVTTALNEYGAILGGKDFLISGIKNVYEKMKPDFIGITSSGLTETGGEDITRMIKDFKSTISDSGFCRILYASTPDYSGVFENGYVTAMLSTLKEFSFKNKQMRLVKKAKKHIMTVNVFCPPSFTPQDFTVLREVFEDFGMKPIMIPDLGSSLDGHLDGRGYAQITSGGVEMNDLLGICESEFNVVIGLSLRKSIKTINILTGLKTFYFQNICGLKNSDRFFRFIEEMTGREIPFRYKRQRMQLMDAYLDSHFYFSGKEIVMALGLDLIDSFSEIYSEIGGNLKIGISTSACKEIEKKFSSGLLTEDLDVLDSLDGLDLMVSNSNAKFYAQNLGIPLLKAGFPVIDEIGHSYKNYILYNGARNIATDSANLLHGA